MLEFLLWVGLSWVGAVAGEGKDFSMLAGLCRGGSHHVEKAMSFAVRVTQRCVSGAG